MQKQIKRKEKDLINDIVSPKKNDGKRKQSQRDKNVDIIQSNQNERIDLQNGSSLEETKSDPKKKPSSRCLKRNKENSNDKEKSDFLLQLNVAFDLENDEFKTRLEGEMDKASIPPE